MKFLLLYAHRKDNSSDRNERNQILSEFHFIQDYATQEIFLKLERELDAFSGASLEIIL